MTDVSFQAIANTSPSASSPSVSINTLKERDNVTNWRNLAIVWSIIAATVVSAILITQWISAQHLGWGWNVLVSVVAITIIGASQHQLGGVIHEGTHHILFADRRLNELASDWLGAFAIYTSTYQFRVHHLAHHQFVNDPDRDPDISQLKDSGHWLDFPVTHMEVLGRLLSQLWLPNLIKFTLVRARYSAVGHDENPYIEKGKSGSKAPVRVGILFAVGVPILLNVLCRNYEAWVAHDALLACWAAVVIYFGTLSDASFPQTRLKPVISHRVTAISRMSFLAIVYGALTLHDAGTGAGVAWDMYGLYWVVPLFTTFPLFMMLRQWIQHGNADRGRYTNTRIFIAGPLLRYAVFPWGMDYHLPHHVMASVPHYKLKDLHAALLARDPEYAEKGVEVEGIFHPPHHAHETGVLNRASILGIMSDRSTMSSTNAVHVDEDAIAEVDVQDRDAIARQSDLSRVAPKPA